MKTCVVTGAGSGIGRAVCIELSKRDEYDNIVLIGRRESALDGTIKKMSKKIIYKYVYDLENLDEIPSLVDSIYKQSGSINALLNIAGYTDPQSVLSTDKDSFIRTYTVNVFATFMLIRSCVKYMKDENTPCKILNVASTAGITPRPGWISYASSKASVISMSQTLTAELAEYGIAVYCISPGRCATDLRRKLAPDEDASTIMQPEEVGEIIVNLISEKENCLDGQNIIIRKKS